MIALQAEVRVALEAVAEAGVILGRIVDHFLAGGQDLMLFLTVGATPAHDTSK